MDSRYKILQGDSAEVLKTLDAESVDCIVTSPPYFGLRKYGSGDKEIGQEKTPVQFVDKLVAVFREAHRVLKDTGTLFVNLGDTYNGDKNGNTEVVKNPKLALTSDGLCKKKWGVGVQKKSLIGVPWRFAIAMLDDGWVLRNDIIWEKRNAMPESVTDRFSKCHEYIFFFTKKPSGYYFDYKAVEEKSATVGVAGAETETLVEVAADDCGEKAEPTDRGAYKNLQDKGQATHSMHERRAQGYKDVTYRTVRKRDVFDMPIKGYSGAHFATYPVKLIEPLILAGCPKGGVVLDTFNGAATTGVVALKLRRRYVGIELNPKYIELSERRIANEVPVDLFDFAEG